MRQIIRKLRPYVLLEAALSSLILSTAPLHANDFEEKLIAKTIANSKTDATPQDVYTINFNNISIIEYIRFVSKITNLNFVFDETELQFNVTIVSEEPISTKNIMSALIQVLRIHNLNLLEQDNNLLITKSVDVNQIPTIVSSDLPWTDTQQQPLITRVFRIKNSNPNTIAGILRPLTSKGAIIEVANETRQLIVTDITTNVEKIASLLTSLDSPHTSLEIENYAAQNLDIAELVALATQILTPFAEGNPLIFVPQTETRSIFIVSTPYLIERAMTVLEDLDAPTKGSKGVSAENTFIYKAQYRSPADLVQDIHQIAKQMSRVNGSSRILNALQSVKVIENSASLLFVVDPNTLPNLKDILSDIDSKEGSQYTFFIYSVKYSDQGKIADSLKQIGKDLKDSGVPDMGLIHTIENMRWVKETNSFIFTGDEMSLKKLQDLLPTIDLPASQAFPGSSEFLIYNPAYRDGEELENSLREIAQNLKQAGLADPAFLNTIASMRWVPTTNSLIFTGNTASLERIQTILKSMDNLESGEHLGQATKTAFFIYKPQNLTPEQLEGTVRELYSDLEKSGLTDPTFLQALNSMQLVESSNSLLFTGTPEALEKLQTLIPKVDVVAGAGGPFQQIGSLTFLVYKPQYVAAPQLMSSLKTLSDDLSKTKAADKDLTTAINSMKWIRETNSILFTGSQQALEKVQELLRKFDIQGGYSEAPNKIPSTFLIYKPRYQSGQELINILSDFEKNLITSGVDDEGLFNTINNLKWIEKTSSILISGDTESIAKVQELLTRFDVPSQNGNPQPSIENLQSTNFLIYKLQYHQGDQIQKALKQVAATLNPAKDLQSQNFLNTVNSIQWINITNSLLATGDQDTLSKLRDLIQNLDVPLRQVFVEILLIETSLTNNQNFGLQWGGQVQYLNKVAGSTGNFPTNQTTTTNGTGNLVQLPNLQQVSGSRFPKAAAVAPATSGDIPFVGQGGFDLGVIGDIIMHKGKSFISLGSLVSALETDSNSTIILNPKIITQDNQNSTIFVGQNIPFAGSTVNISGGASTAVTSNLEYRDVGLNLSITPVLGYGDIVTMDIMLDITQQIASTTTSNTVTVQGIQTSKTSLNTKVHVPDKAFLALSGLINDSKARLKNSIPCLGGLPVVGAVFSNNIRTATKQNVILFIRPHIIDSFAEYRQLTENQENLYKEEAVLPLLKEEFDSGIDLVKKPEDE